MLLPIYRSPAYTRAMKMNPKAVAKAIANNQQTALKVAVEKDWRIRTSPDGQSLILSNRAEAEK